MRIDANYLFPPFLKTYLSFKLLAGGRWSFFCGHLAVCGTNDNNHTCKSLYYVQTNQQLSSRAVAEHILFDCCFEELVQSKEGQNAGGNKRTICAFLVSVYIQWHFVFNRDFFRKVFFASIILLPLLGLTWLFGLLAVNNNLTVFTWIFTILNSLQVSRAVYSWVNRPPILILIPGCFYLRFPSYQEREGKKTKLGI